MKPARRFAFRLALELGEPNPDAMLSRMPYRIFREWQTYYQYDPFGGDRLDVNFARLMAWIGEVNRSKKSSPHFKAKQFMLKWGPKDPPSPDNMINKMIVLTKLYGGTIIDNRKKVDGN